jgi:hypothetical protein
MGSSISSSSILFAVEAMISMKVMVLTTRAHSSRIEKSWYGQAEE